MMIIPITKHWALCLLLSVIVGVIACGPGKPAKVDSPPANEDESEQGPNWFEDVTDAVGLDFVQDPGPTGTYFMPQALGSGCAFIHDGDGTLYIYLLQCAGPDSKSVSRLYKRLPSGKFTDVTAGSGLGIAGWNMGVAVADVNNDGRPDVFVTQYGGIRLFLNIGGGRFEDVTEEAGLSSSLWGASAAFFDYDRDGWLDLVVANYVEYDPSRVCESSQGKKDYCSPANFQGTGSKLFRNLGPAAAVGDKSAARVRFQDVSFASGIGRLPGPGLGVVCADFDGDGWPDIFISNDGKPNRLWINRRDGTFSEEAASRGLAYTSTGKAFAGMGIALGDTNNDGRMGLYVTHMNNETNTLWRQERPGQFRDTTAEAGLTSTLWRATGFGTLMADFNLDGFVDIAIVNGRVFRGESPNDTGLGFWEPYSERNQILANDGNGTFRDLSKANKPFCGYWNVGRGLAVDDFDDDGAPDLLVTTVGGRARLFRNVAPNRGHWLKVRAFDPKSKRDAYGAEVRLRVGDRHFMRVLNPANSFFSSSSPLALFGIGSATHVDSILVNWPDGTEETFPGGRADRTVVLNKGEGRKP